MNAQVQTQAQGEKRVRSPFLKRIIQRCKHFLKRTIGGTRLYEAMRVGYHYYTKPTRCNSGSLVIKKHRAKKKGQYVRQKQEEVRWSRQTPSVQFTPLSLTQTPMPEQTEIQVHAIPLCGGAPIQVVRNGDLARRYNEEVVRQEVDGIPTQPASLRPVTQAYVMDIFTPIVPEVLPESIGVTQQDAEFLLDRAFPHQEADPDVTTKRSAIKKAG